MFDSPGGSLLESLKMGAYIADIPATVSAQVGASDIPNAICASACVYAYIAADYRYISNGARIGIHRFGFTETNLDGNEGAAIGQALSGIFSEYIRSHRVEPALFEAVSSIDHSDILWVSDSDLEKWRLCHLCSAKGATGAGCGVMLAVRGCRNAISIHAITSS